MSLQQCLMVVKNLHDSLGMSGPFSDGLAATLCMRGQWETKPNMINLKHVHPCMPDLPMNSMFSCKPYLVTKGQMLFKLNPDRCSCCCCCCFCWLVAVVVVVVLIFHIVFLLHFLLLHFIIIIFSYYFSSYSYFSSCSCYYCCSSCHCCSSSYCCYCCSCQSNHHLS